MSMSVRAAPSVQAAAPTAVLLAALKISFLEDVLQHAAQGRQQDARVEVRVCGSCAQ